MFKLNSKLRDIEVKETFMPWLGKTLRTVVNYATAEYFAEIKKDKCQPRRKN